MRSASASTSGRSRGDEDDRLAGAGERVEPAIDVGAGADVDAARRLDQDEDVGVGEVPAREQRLLLVAAGERAHRHLERGGDDAEVAQLARSTARRSAAGVDDAGRPARGRASEATAMFSRSGRLGRMPSCFRSSVRRQMPAATASCGRAERQHRRRPWRCVPASARRSPPISAGDLVLAGAEEAGQRHAPRRAGRRSETSRTRPPEARPVTRRATGAAGARGRRRRSARPGRRSSPRSAAPRSSRQGRW